MCLVLIVTARLKMIGEEEEEKKKKKKKKKSLNKLGRQQLQMQNCCQKAKNAKYSSTLTYSRLEKRTCDLFCLCLFVCLAGAKITLYRCIVVIYVTNDRSWRHHSLAMMSAMRHERARFTQQTEKITRV